MDFGFMRFSYCCNVRFQSPRISYFFMWCLFSLVSKEHTAPSCLSRVQRPRTFDIPRSITFQRPLRLLCTLRTNFVYSLISSKQDILGFFSLYIETRAYGFERDSYSEKAASVRIISQSEL